ncbi:ribonuclease H-like domain-containing protein [Tanacetum coccineum]|uniref:Ribonuclease H-like domain-containing protein n=1 Tax=Tanacetum coccineum TaxID=301880 RepID=A0ABQ5HKJ7_9ASTR
MVQKPMWNNAMRVNHQNSARMTHPHLKRNFVPIAVLTRSGKVPINTAKQNLLKAAVSVNTVRPINIDVTRPKVNGEKTMRNTFNKAHSSVKRPFNNLTAKKNINYYHRVNTVKGTGVNTARLRQTVNTARPKAAVNAARSRVVVKTARLKAVLKAVKGNMGQVQVSDGLGPQKRLIFLPYVQGNPEQELQGRGIFDSGCFRHMTGNKSYLTNFEEIDGGFVTFGGNSRGGKITGKGKIRTGSLDFDDVYFVKEMKFNLLSVSQMCNKKNSVLFTDTECFILSSDFKLADENHVLLKVPRKDNMYSVDLKNIVPKRGKATQSFLFSWIFFLATKDKTSRILKSFITGIENLIDLKVKVIRSDNGTKFKNRVINEFCEMKGIRREFSVARTSQQNGVAKRKNRTLIEATRTMLADSKLPTTF